MKLTKKDLSAVKNLLTRLTAVSGITGREGPVADVAAIIMRKLGLISVGHTALGSVYGCIPAGTVAPKAKTILLQAHIDQVGLVVTSVENGFLHIANCGGIDRRLLPAARVVIKTQNGEYLGIVSSVPPHLKKDDNTPPKIEDMLVDTGMAPQRAAQLFAPGDTITIPAQCTQLQGSRMAGSAFDDRAGCAAVLRAAQIIAGHSCKHKVFVLLSSMEEVGGQGASTAANLLKPDYCYAVDVSFGDGPGIPENRCGKVGKGAMIGYAPVLNRKMCSTLVQLAKEQNIPYQCEVMGGTTGTDADKIVTSGTGVKTALLSIPLRNMHSCAELVDLEDIEGTARLIAMAVLKEDAHD